MKISNLNVERESFCLSIDSLTFNSNDKVAIIGKSGSGKTTLLNSIGNIVDYSGIIENKQHVVYATQFGDLIDEFSVNTNVVMGEFANNNVFKNIYLTLTSNPIEVLSKLKIDKLQKKKVKTLSGGEAQRVLIARSLNTKGEIFLFDEPTSSLDIKNSEICIQTILENLSDKIVICTIHNLNLLKFFERVIIMENGKIISDTPYKSDLKYGDYFE